MTTLHRFHIPTIKKKRAHLVRALLLIAKISQLVYLIDFVENLKLIQNKTVPIDKKN